MEITSKTKKNIEDLNLLYKDAEECDQKIFAEMRSNVLLCSGDHWANAGDMIGRNFLGRALNDPEQSKKKIRLVQNHIGRIVSLIKNSILSGGVDVQIFPYNETELQDTKAAEISSKVFKSIKQVNSWDDKVDDWISSFIGIGEVACKVFFDPNKGNLVGYHQEVDELGQPVFDMMGQPTPDKTKPQFAGEVAIETIHPFNLLRDPNAESLKESPYLISRKMIPVERAKKLVSDEDLAKKIQESSDQTFKIFDGNSGSYLHKKGQVLVREFYFRKSVEFPCGYYYITVGDTGAGFILAEGELPFGDDDEMFPIITEGWDKIPTSARYRAIIKQLRHGQREMNRLVSERAEQQIKFGRPKVIINSGSKLSKGFENSGIDFLQLSGPPPTFMETRNGENLQAPIQETKDSIYELSNTTEMNTPQDPANLEALAAIYRSIRDKQRFSIYAQKFERFLINVCKTSVKVAKHYYDENHVFRASGGEVVNIQEFKNTNPWNYDIQVEATTDDADSVIGRAYQLQNVMQYMGSDLPTEVKGTIIRSLPFLNGEKIAAQLTLDSDSAENMLLALDRGEQWQPSKYDKTEIMLPALINRTRKLDYKLLAPQIQANYDTAIQTYEGIEADQKKRIQQDQAGFIPTTGAAIGVDKYTETTNSAGGLKYQRLRVPEDALSWLVEMLDKQNMTQDQIEKLDNAAAMAEIADKTVQQQQQGPGEMGMAPQPQMPMEAQNGFGN